MSNTTIKLTGLSPIQVDAFTKHFPVLSSSGLVAATQSTLAIELHPQVFGADVTPESARGKLARALQVHQTLHGRRRSVAPQTAKSLIRKLEV